MFFDICIRCCLVGNSFMKLEDKDKLKILSESQLDPKLSNGSGMLPKSPEATTPGLNLPSDFFLQEERTSPHELEGVLQEIIFNALDKRSLHTLPFSSKEKKLIVCHRCQILEQSELRHKVHDFSNAELLRAAIVRQLINEITKDRLEETYTKSDCLLSESPRKHHH